MINVAKIYSTLGNSNSLIPLAVKDISATAGMTAGSFVTGKEEGQDRLIDELGTEAIWLLGIPAFKWIYDNTVLRLMGLDAKFDPRNLKNKDVFEKIKQYAPEEVKGGIEKIATKQKLFKGAAAARFVVSTALTVGAYFGLTKFKQNYTEKKIRENLISEYSNKVQTENFKEESAVTSNPSFKGAGEFIQSFAFSPVKNMWILDGFITGTRLKESRTPQEFVGYGIKEAFTLCFMYYAGDKIQQLLENHANKKYNKSIGLDARVIEGGALKRAFEDGSIEKSLEAFSKLKDEASIYEFLMTNPDNEIVKAAKQSDIIKMYKKTGNIDTRKFIDLEEIKGVNNKIKELYSQYKDALIKGEASDEFFNGVKKLKRGSIRTNILSCIFALGILTPGIMLAKRLSGKDDTEFQTKKEIREKLIKEGVIK